MNVYSKVLVRATRIFFTLAAGIFLIPKLPAQPAPPSVDNRLLLIFDTSADMKKRVPAVQKTLKVILATSIKGELHAGDSIGVWTFGQNVRAGQFPLQQWIPENAVMIVSNITTFVEHQHYAKKTSFKGLSPLLDQVIQNSQRLTVLIFCDGEAQISGTPYDAGINQIFQQGQSKQKKARQPFVIVLRAQLGGYIGGSVSLPPATINFPEFPPLPLPPAPIIKAPPINPPPPVPVIEAPPLIIVGTNVETNWPPPVTETTNVLPTNVMKLTNVISVPPKISVVETNPVASTNVIAAPPENPGISSGGALILGAIFLLAAGAVGFFTWCRAGRKNSASLITRSINKK